MNGNIFIYKPLTIIKDKRLTPMERDYLCLISQLQKAGGCIASNQYFADYFGVKRQTAQGVIRNLVQKGLIGRLEKKQGGKTIKRTIEIIDEVSRNILLSDGRNSLPIVSRESTVGLAGDSDKDSRKPSAHTIERQQSTTTDNKYSPSSIEYKLVELLLNEILKRKPDFKKPNIQQWAHHINLMLNRDNRQPERIEAIIRWVQQDSFWQNNILSTAKLREKFDQLELIKNGKSNTQHGFESNDVRPRLR